jgi:putative ABC transport system ATP-binding protein
VSLVSLKNVTKRYQAGDQGVEALKGISLEIEADRFISIIGPSGSGKTTLLNLIGCIDKPTGGEITIDGQAVQDLNRRSGAEFRGKRFGFIFQSFNLIPVLSAYENVEYPLLMIGDVHEKERRERVLELLRKVGMLERRDHMPDKISGGQKQRVAIARALVLNPKVVLADEPTANLDHETALRVIEVMHEMKREFGTTFIFSTHDQRIVDEAETIFTLEDGAIVDSREMSRSPK